MGTFEAPLHQQHVIAITKVRAKQVSTAALSLVTHVNSLLPTGCSCWNAVLHFTINADSKLIFLYCSDMQIRSSVDIRYRRERGRTRARARERELGTKLHNGGVQGEGVDILGSL
jgi:hypothetical protein